MTYFDILTIAFTFFGVVWLVWNYIAADLPDDFLARIRRDRKSRPVDVPESSSSKFGGRW